MSGDAQVTGERGQGLWLCWGGAASLQGDELQRQSDVRLRQRAKPRACKGPQLFGYKQPTSSLSASAQVPDDSFASANPAPAGGSAGPGPLPAHPHPHGARRTRAGRPRLDTTCCESLLLTSVPWPRASRTQDPGPRLLQASQETSPSRLSQDQRQVAGRGLLCSLPVHQPGLCGSPAAQETPALTGPRVTVPTRFSAPGPSGGRRGPPAGEGVGSATASNAGLSRRHPPPRTRREAGAQAQPS